MTDSPVDRGDIAHLARYTSIAFMVYGRVIGNELRDVPPECLPIWGQRWSGYHAPHGPSPFSTRVFSADQMYQVGPALTSPTQFEVTLTEEDEVEDASSESGQFRSSFLLSPLAVQPEANELMSRPETLMPRSIHRSSNHPHDSPKILHRSNGRPPLRNPARLGATLPVRWQSELLGTQDCASHPLLHPPALRHGILIRNGHGPRENDYTPWDADRTSTGFQLRAGQSYSSQVPSGQLQYTIPPHSIPEWQFDNTHAQSSAHPRQLNPSPQSGSGLLLLPFQADDLTFGSTTSSSPSHCFTIPFPQDVAIDPHRSQESSSTRISGIEQLQYPIMPSWPQESTLPTRLSQSRY